MINFISISGQGVPITPIFIHSLLKLGTLLFHGGILIHQLNQRLNIYFLTFILLLHCIKIPKYLAFPVKKTLNKNFRFLKKKISKFFSLCYCYSLGTHGFPQKCSAHSLTYVNIQIYIYIYMNE